MALETKSSQKKPFRDNQGHLENPYDLEPLRSRPSLKISDTLCASLRSRNALQHFIRTALYGNLHVKGQARVRTLIKHWPFTPIPEEPLSVDTLFGEKIRTWCVVHISTSKCASRHNSVNFFGTSTCKSGPNAVLLAFDFEICFPAQRRARFQHLNVQKCSERVVFAHVDFEMFFAPQRRALFEHLNFQKCSGPDVLFTFWLPNALPATTAYVHF